MENLIIISFPDAKNASGALGKLQDLDLLGDINIYNYALIRKTGDNQFDLIQHEGPDTDALPAIGVIGGSMIGLIGGPIGVGMGMLTGALVGSADEEDNLAFSDEVLEKAKDKLLPGEFAIVLDVEEDNDFFINSYIDPFHGLIARTDITSQYEEYDDQKWDELNKEIDAGEKSLKTAVNEDKTAIKAKIDKLKKERDERFQKMKSRSAKRKKVLEDKIKTFDEKIKKSTANAEDKLKLTRKKLAEKLEAANAKLDWA
ncbi:MAG TPA: hypothetical protein VK772_19155, partial [Puia sp.]|nr:hypothetical protein [Puia sp.]